MEQEQEVLDRVTLKDLDKVQGLLQSTTKELLMPLDLEVEQEPHQEIIHQLKDQVQGHQLLAVETKNHQEVVKELDQERLQGKALLQQVKALAQAAHQLVMASHKGLAQDLDLVRLVEKMHLLLGLVQGLELLPLTIVLLVAVDQEVEVEVLVEVETLVRKNLPYNAKILASMTGIKNNA
jgi:hypothetical protein